MKKNAFPLSLLAVLVILFVFAPALRAEHRVTQATFDETIANWPDKPREVANKMIAKYGLPNEATPSLLIWHNNGPWKRTILSREETPHNFPKPHTDLLEQFINYRVPPDKFDELARYDGSVIVERTRGELSARCDKEEMNFLALNLANDVATGRRSVDDARRFYTDAAMAAMKGDMPTYTRGLQFQSQAASADPDSTTTHLARGLSAAEIDRLPATQLRAAESTITTEEELTTTRVITTKD